MLNFHFFGTEDKFLGENVKFLSICLSTGDSLPASAGAGQIRSVPKAQKSSAPGSAEPFALSFIQLMSPVSKISSSSILMPRASISY